MSSDDSIDDRDFSSRGGGGCGVSSSGLRASYNKQPGHLQAKKTSVMGGGGGGSKQTIDMHLLNWQTVTMGGSAAAHAIKRQGSADPYTDHLAKRFTMSKNSQLMQSMKT